MKAEWIAADRAYALREAAAAWHAAGAISREALDAITMRFPDDRVRVGGWFRALFAVLAAAGAASLWLAWVLESPGSTYQISTVAFGGFLIGLTEVLQGTFRLDRCGAEEATGLMGALWLSWGLDRSFRGATWIHGHSQEAVFLGIVALLLALAFYRWGSPLLAGLASAGGLGCLAQGTWGRIGWLLMIGPAWFLLGSSEKSILPPRQRTGLRWAALVLLAGAYAAVNLDSVEVGWIEGQHPDSWRGWRGPLDAWIAAAYVGTLLAPIAFWALALRRRQRELLWLALAVTGASAWTIASRFDWLPGWLGLMLGGLVLLGAVFALRRWLASGPNGERHGFTAEPLYESAGALGLVEVAAVATLPTPQAPGRPDFEGQGGRFGGGGASSSF
jgi:hypothetical protein